MDSNMQTTLFDRSESQGRLEFTGRDRFDLLHRMSTNDFSKIQPGEGRSTVLTTALARIIDRVIVYSWGERAVMLTNQPATVRGWLQKHIFYQDQVKLRDVSAELGQLEVYGPQASQIVGSLTPDAQALTKLALHHFVELSDGQGLVAPTFPLLEAGYTLVAPMTALDGLKQTLIAGGAVLGDAAAYESLRIQAGQPGPGHELTEDYIPLEANLWESVSFSKGCYIGQEIIARMESRNRLAKTLTRLRLPALVPPGASLVADGLKVGTLTSITTLADGSLVGLGFVRPEKCQAGTQLTVEVEGQPGATADVIPLLDQVRANH